MKTEFDADLEAFRQEVRKFLAESLSRDIREAIERAGGEPDGFLDQELTLRWHKILLEKGWAAPGWPKEHGGCDWSLAQRYIFDAELVAANAPPAIDFTFNMVGPMVIVFGTEAQKRRLLPPMINGDIWWCQGFSEPYLGDGARSPRLLRPPR